MFRRFTEEITNTYKQLTKQECKFHQWLAIMRDYSFHKTTLLTHFHAIIIVLTMTLLYFKTGSCNTAHKMNDKDKKLYQNKKCWFLFTVLCDCSNHYTMVKNRTEKYAQVRLQALQSTRDKYPCASLLSEDLLSCADYRRKQQIRMNFVMYPPETSTSKPAGGTAV